MLRFAPILILCSCWPTRGQSPPEKPRFQTESANVVVDVIVTDKKGKPVPHLTADDFQITEDGIAQRILSFEAPTVSAESTAVATTQAGTTAIQDTRNPRARFLILVMDQGDMMPQGRRDAIQAARRYVDKVLQPFDYVAVYEAATRLRMVTPFTRDKEQIRAGIQSFAEHPNDGVYTASDRNVVEQRVKQLIQQEQRVAAHDPMRADMLRAERLALQNDSWTQTGFQAKAVFVALRALAQASSVLPARKNIVLFSEGFTHSPDAAAELAAVIDSANRANAAFYVIDTGGLRTSAPESSSDAENSSNMAAPGRGRNARRMVPNTYNEQMAEMARSGRRVGGRGDHVDPFEWAQHLGINSDHADLRELAESTGGLLIKDKNRLDGALEQIDHDLRENYTLVYRPQNSKYDGAFRNIRVSVRDYRVRYRKGYWAIPPEDAMQMTPAAAQLITLADTGALQPKVAAQLNASLVFGAQAGFDVPVSVWLPQPRKVLTRTGENYVAAANLVVTARNAAGKLLAVSHRFLNLSFTEAELKAIEGTGYQIYSRLVVPNAASMDMQAILQFSDGSAALANSKVEVSARTTSLFLTDRVQPAEAQQTMLDSLRIQDYQLIPCAQHKFHAGDALTLYLGLLDVPVDNAGNPRMGVEIHVLDGPNVVRNIPLSGLVAANGHFFLLKQFRMEGAAPHEYLLEAVVHDDVKNTTVRQSVPFAIH